MILKQEDYNQLNTIVSVLMLSQLMPQDELLRRLRAQCLLPKDLLTLAKSIEIMRVSIERIIFTLDDIEERRAGIDTIHWCMDAGHEIEHMLNFC